MTRRMTTRLVAAVADNGVIGADGGIPWHIPGDFAHFRRVTTGHALVMGRATYDSIGRPLPGRPNIVITRAADWSADGVEVAHSLAEALTLAASYGGDVAVIGGAQVYAEALPLVDELVLTRVRVSPPGDTHFPPIEPGEWQETASGRRPRASRTSTTRSRGRSSVWRVVNQLVDNFGLRCDRLVQPTS
jgi:dihydrofolate reductase